MQCDCEICQRCAREWEAMYLFACAMMVELTRVIRDSTGLCWWPIDEEEED